MCQLTILYQIYINSVPFSKAVFLLFMELSYSSSSCVCQVDCYAMTLQVNCNIWWYKWIFINNYFWNWSFPEWLIKTASEKLFFGHHSIVSSQKIHLIVCVWSMVSWIVGNYASNQEEVYNIRWLFKSANSLHRVTYCISHKQCLLVKG